LCWSLAAVNQLEKARAACDHSLLLRSNDAGALDSRGLVNLKSGNVAAAIADYDEALKIRPNYDSSLYGRGISRRKSGDEAGGNADIQAALAIRKTIADDFKKMGIQ
jgi:tetratricopeptide (TPR) repeat protein